jgi:hypothetical protein
MADREHGPKADPPAFFLDSPAHFGGGFARDANDGQLADSEGSDRSLRRSELPHDDLSQALRDSVALGEIRVRLR